MLCLVLTFVSPTTAFYQVFFHAIPELIAAQTLTHTVLLSVYSVLFSVVAVMSIVAGTRLWLIRSGAVRFARRYLLTYLGANIAYFVFWLLVVRPTQPLSLAEMGWHHVVVPIGSTALWYIYLVHSKRVRKTYPDGC